MTRKRALKLLAFVVYLACVCEGMTRLAWEIPRVADRMPMKEEDWWRTHWLKRHKETGQDVFYDFDLYDPTKGWRARPNVRDRVAFGDKVLNTNSRGLRGKTDYTYEKHPGQVRILVFGDSFTFGDEVSDDDTYCHYLQRMLPQAEVINMGVHGYGHDQMLIFLEEEGVKYQPDIVVLGFLPMDMLRNVLAFRDYAKPKFVVRDGALALTGSPVPRPEDTLKQHGSRSRALDLVGAVWEKFEKTSGHYETNAEKTTTAILTEMVNVTRRVGATPIFVYLPLGEEVSAPGMTKGEAYLSSMCAQDGNVRYFSTRLHFAEEAKRGENFKPLGHWQPVGHRIAAEAIAAYLRSEGYVGPPSARD